MDIGITGHQRLEESRSWPWVRQHVDAILSQAFKPVVGITSLAIGADQVFAQSVLQHGGRLAVVVPFEGYENAFSDDRERGEYHRLLRFASTVEVLARMKSDEDSYCEAGKRVVDLCHILIAVWDGKPAAGRGGTADIVNYALEMGKSTIHISPVTFKVRIASSFPCA